MPAKKEKGGEFDAARKELDLRVTGFHKNRKIIPRESAGYIGIIRR